MNERIVRIGGASGAWGDSPMAVGQLVAAGVDFLMMDFLAEVTMSLLAKARLKDPAAGYPPDFVAYLLPHLAEMKRRGVRVASNAGGVNPRACKRALEAAAASAGVAMRVAVVEGDDVLPITGALREEGVREWRSDAPLPPALLTANAYLGARPIAAAFDHGADVVITGRCVDSALALGILMHTFGWADDDFDRLAAGSLVGHVLECGAQATGGLYTDWEAVPGWADIGYPIAECRADGSFVVAKPDGSGGLVSPASVAEQVLYEIGDPASYELPDVIADFSAVRVEAAGESRVRVSGARGRPPGPALKVSATWQHGHRAVALLAIVGVDAAKKAERTAAALLERARAAFAMRGLADFSAVHVEALGAEASYGAGSRTRDTREVVLRLVVEHADARALELIAREVGSSGMAFAPGTVNLLGGRPRPAPVIRLVSFFVDKARLAAPTVQVGDEAPLEVQWSVSEPRAPASGSASTAAGIASASADRHGSNTQPTSTGAPAAVAMVEVPLATVAHARSGDKGDTSNIAIFCRERDYVDHLRTILTPERMRLHFVGLVDGPAERFEAPGLAAFNFVLERALGGGGMASLRIDPLGKSYGQRALEMKVAVPASWLDGSG